MTFEQTGILVLLAVMLMIFATNRFPMELVALCGLAAGGLLSIVTPQNLFLGFANPTVITVLEILLIVQVLRRSHIIDLVGGVLTSRATSDRSITIGLAGLGAFLSIFMNNIGALALIMPLALSICESQNIPVRRVMMPLSFATLLGGLCSVVGTPANLIGSDAMMQVRGEPFSFFELGYIGFPLLALGLVYLYFTTPKSLRTPRPREDARRRHTRKYVIELITPARSSLVGKSISQLEDENEVTVHNIVRDQKFVFGDHRRSLKANDLVIVELSEDALKNLVGTGQLVDPTMNREIDGNHRVEAVILPESTLVGSRVNDLEALAGLGIDLVAVGIPPRRIEGRLGHLRLAIGDILVLRGKPETIAAEIAECGLLALSPTVETAPKHTVNLLPILLFAIGVGASAIFSVPPAIAFGLVVLALTLVGDLSLRQGFEGLNWPILIMLGAMIPLGNAVADTGAARVLAEGVTGLMPEVNSLALSAAMLLLSVGLTPFINNPSTVLVLSPIGVEIARQYGLAPELIIIAIVVGASLDFMTPFGHHNNTLVMGVAGYSFGDFLRLGFPLVVMCYAVTLAAIFAFF